jgi:hypothetical protein
MQDVSTSPFFLKTATKIFVQKDFQKIKTKNQNRNDVVNGQRDELRAFLHLPSEKRSCLTALGWYLGDLNAHLQRARTICGPFHGDLKI